MFKAIKILLLLAVIVLLAAFIYAKAGSIGPDTNYFNTHYRAKLDRYPLLRNILDLHYDGDARGDFLGPQYAKIVIEADAIEGVNVDTNFLDRLAKKIQNITGKPTSYFVSDTNITLYNLTNTDIASIARRYRNTVSGSGSASLYVLLADRKKDEPKLLGSTYEESGIVLYINSLQDFTKDSPSTLGNYVFSTALHEFGHQIGLDHNDNFACLMNSKAEVSDQARFDPYGVVTDFCDSEKLEIQQLKLQSQS